MQQEEDRWKREVSVMTPSFLKNELALYQVGEVHGRGKTGKKDKEYRFGLIKLKIGFKTFK